MIYVFQLMFHYLTAPVTLSLSIAYAISLIFISIGDTKSVLWFILQSVDSLQELVCFCCLFKFYHMRLVRINIIRSAHVYLRFPEFLQLMKMLKALNVTVNTTGICQWCWHLKQCNTEQIQRQLVKETDSSSMQTLSQEVDTAWWSKVVLFDWHLSA